MSSYSHGCHCPACRAANTERAGRHRLGHPLADRPHQLALSHVPLTGTWHINAACRDLGPDLFFPADGKPFDPGPAQAICMTCPVLAECRTYSLTYAGLHGVFGGLDAADRRRLRRDIRDTA